MRLTHLLVPWLAVLCLGGCASTETTDEPAPSRAASPLGDDPFADPDAMQFDEMYVIFYKAAVMAPSMTLETLQRIQSEHLAHLGTIADSGRLLHAGPFADHTNSGLRGIVIMKPGAFESHEDVIEIAKLDPAVRAGRLDYDVVTWYRPVEAPE